MSDPLTDIMQALCDALTAINSPAGGPIKATLEPPDTTAAFPTAVLLERAIDPLGGIEQGFGMSLGYAQDYPKYYLDVHLCFAPEDQKYSVRLKREWTSAVLMALMANDSLGGVVTEMSFGRISFESFSYNGTSYLCTTYPLELIRAA